MLGALIKALEATAAAMKFPGVLSAEATSSGSVSADKGEVEARRD